MSCSNFNAKMASWCLLALLSFSLCIFHTTAVSESDFNEYPHTIYLQINNLFLYTLSTKASEPVNIQNAETVLDTILSKYHIKRDQINFEGVLKTLLQKIKWIFRQLKNASGSKKQRYMKKLKESSYTLVLPHRSGSPTKRKFEEVNNELQETKEELYNTKEMNNELERKLNRLANPKKRRRGERGKTKGKLNYSDSQKLRHKKQKIEQVQSTFEELSSEGLKPLRFAFLDEFGDEVTVCMDKDQEVKTQYCQDDIDEMVYVLDMYNIPDKGYHDLSMRKQFAVPKSNRVIDRRHALNTGINLRNANGNWPGVFTSINESLSSKLTDPKRANLIRDGKVRIKLSGDGTKLSCKQHVVNVSYTFVDESTCMSEHGNYLLAIVKCDETNASIRSALHDLILEFENLSSIVVNGQEIQIEKYLGGDLKFLNQMMGIAGFASKYSCLWCRCSKEERFDMSKNWSTTDTKKGARTINEIISCTQKKASDKTKFNCIEEPVFPSVPVHRVLPDTLHLLLRICDQLLQHLILFLRKMDNVEKCTVTTSKLKNSQHIKRFQTFINDTVGICDWKFFISKEGKLDYRSFRGPEHRRLLKKIDLDHLIPSHPNLEGWKTLWREFPLLHSQMDRDLRETEINAFEQAAREWVDLYYKINCSTDVTPYMHVLSCHVPEAMRLHGKLSRFCQQGLEKVNDLVTKWYCRSTNFGSKAMEQVMAKQHRLHYLESVCKRTPKWVVSCSNCLKDGHNKRTCDQHQTVGQGYTEE